MSPDSAESILLSYLISICIMPPVSQSLHFRGQGVGSKLQKTIFFFVEATIIRSEIHHTVRQARSLPELLMRVY